MQRSKGLGENDPEMMWMTTMNPATRRLIKVMPEDAEPDSANTLTCCWGITWQAARSISRKTATSYLELADSTQ